MNSAADRGWVGGSIGLQTKAGFKTPSSHWFVGGVRWSVNFVLLSNLGRLRSSDEFWLFSKASVEDYSDLL